MATVDSRRKLKQVGDKKKKKVKRKEMDGKNKINRLLLLLISCRF